MCSVAYEQVVWAVKYTFVRPEYDAILSLHIVPVTNPSPLDCFHSPLDRYYPFYILSILDIYTQIYAVCNTHILRNL